MYITVGGSHCAHMLHVRWCALFRITLFAFIYGVGTALNPLSIASCPITAASSITSIPRAPSKQQLVGSGGYVAVPTSGPRMEIPPEWSVIVLPKGELDKANKDKRHFPSSFQVRSHM